MTDRNGHFDRSKSDRTAAPDLTASTVPISSQLDDGMAKIINTAFDALKNAMIDPTTSSKERRLAATDCLKLIVEFMNNRSGGLGGSDRVNFNILGSGDAVKDALKAVREVMSTGEVNREEG